MTLWMRRFPGMTGSTPMLLWPAPLLQQLPLLCTHGEWLCTIDLAHTGLTAALTHLRTACIAQHSSTLSDIPCPTHQPWTLRETYFYDIYSSPCRGICGNISLHASVGVSLCSLLRRRSIRTIYTTCPPPSALLGSPPYPAAAGTLASLLPEHIVLAWQVCLHQLLRSVSSNADPDATDAGFMLFFFNSGTRWQLFHQMLLYPLRS